MTLNTYLSEVSLVHRLRHEPDAMFILVCPKL